MFIVDLNATIRRGFTNLTADYQKVRLEIGVGVDFTRDTSIFFIFFSHGNSLCPLRLVGCYSLVSINMIRRQIIKFIYFLKMCL